MWKNLPSLAVSLAVGVVLCVGALSLVGSLASARPPLPGQGLNSIAPVASRALGKSAEAICGDAPPPIEVVRSGINLVKRQLKATEIRSGVDFLNAARISSKGSTAEDALLAHDLAACALALGERGARPILAASLDQYLVRTGQKQRFGTQSTGDIDGAITEGMRFIMGIDNSRPDRSTNPQVAAKADSMTLNLVIEG